MGKVLIPILIMFLAIGLMKANAKELSEEVIQQKAEEYYVKYKFEWDYILKDISKKNIRTSYLRGSINDRGYSAAISDFLESRGGMNKYMVNIYITKSYKKNGKTIKGKVSMDCGRYGINTRTFAYYNKLEYSTEKSVDYCFALKNDDELAFAHFNKTMDIAEKRYKDRGYTSKEYFRKVMNYYNSGKDKYTGEHYIKSIALVRMFKEVL